MHITTVVISSFIWSVFLCLNAYYIIACGRVGIVSEWCYWNVDIGTLTVTQQLASKKCSIDVHCSIDLQTKCMMIDL